MGILFLTVKQERCSDLLLWSAAWLLPPLRLMPMLMLTTATAMALDSAMLVSATLDWAMVDTVLDMEATVIPVLDTPTARGRLRLSPRLMPSTDTELTPTPLDTVTPVSAMLPLPLPLLPSLPLSPPLLPPLSLPQPSLPPFATVAAAPAVAAPALGYAGLGYAGLGYAGLGYGHYYGKREAEAEPKADAYYGYGYGLGHGYAGLGYGYAGLGYGYGLGAYGAGYGHYYG